jgi:hypothetical protein
MIESVNMPVRICSFTFSMSVKFLARPKRFYGPGARCSEAEVVRTDRGARRSGNRKALECRGIEITQ